jgi:hypothetical protein
MANIKRAVQFANFICHFGELEMLDLCEEIVIPAFTNAAFRRSYKDTTYFFHDVQLITITEEGKHPEPAIAGKFVKDTILEREQIYEEGKLVRSPHKIASAPSSLFVLVLRDHKLLFFPEVSGAPGIESFRSTTMKFLKKAHNAFIGETIESMLEHEFPDGASQEENRKIREAVLEKYPLPDLEVVSLASEETLDAFVERFDKLKSFSIKLLRPNNEINNDGFFEKIRGQGDYLNASSAKLNYSNTEGLDKNHVKNHAESALDGNAEIDLKGTDTEGRKLSGSNEDFKIQVVIEGIPKAIKSAAQRLFSTFSTYKKSGLIKTGLQVPSIEKEAKLLRLTQQFSGGRDGNA